MTIATSQKPGKDRHLQMRGRVSGLLNTNICSCKGEQSMVPEASLRPLTAKPSGATASQQRVVALSLLLNKSITGQECLCSLLLRVCYEFVCRTFLNDYAAIHEYDPVSNVTRKAHLMGNDNHRHLLFSEILDDI